jgi:hypothetical protein
MNDEETNDRRMSRRRVVAGIAGGTVTAWAAPTVLSLGSTAYANGSPPAAACKTCPTVAVDLCDEANDCYTVLTTAGACACTQIGECEELVACDAGACPDGFVCAVTCCGEPLCVPLCAQEAPRAFARGVAAPRLEPGPGRTVHA